MNRPDLLKSAVSQTKPWDIIIIGGGATGVGVAVDAATRGYSTLLLEQHDYGKGTSSRSTKLVHGGVRYLEQGNVSLVMEALKERGIMRQNAPHLVSELPFIVPSYSWWEGPFYGIGLKLYQMLSGKYGFGPSKIVSREETLKMLPNVNTEGLSRGVIYYDGQFDDSRLLINMVTTAIEQGGTLLNYAKVTGLNKGTDGTVESVTWQDMESGKACTSSANVIINATGPFTDGVRKMAEPDTEPMISPSQGAHIVLDRSFLPGDTAIMVPHTSDGRVMFAIPWHGHTLVGTTDTAIEASSMEPVPMDQEIEFMLGTAALYLEKKPTRADILSAFAGIRPLVKAGGGKNTAALSRDHTIHIDQSGLLTITGGKWTTYRNMAQDCVNHAATLGDLPERDCVTKTLNIHGYHPHSEKFGAKSVYGSDAPLIDELAAGDPSLGAVLDDALPYIAAEVVWAARHEFARTVEDVLSRRTRALFLNAKAAVRMAPKVAELLAKELGNDEVWQSAQVESFTAVARGYMVR
ncbi:glycerol-3-phosphate dehydrogenase [Roseimicrobium gellanilyticum]|uniref:Glycerol-3-phosphate dehydrogenase n=1 Tax=Roseimicrobium gellanilyticum TaxID=748857 RepID=A0A366HNV8_9BACT|nr:FAD-dependent oxidoreductase [Roseimicrobium gellanilyticum]RBP45177.1 glycerol-3-phosphate dehydrogenase [Roseimicrobium gellanilyticum]